LNNTFREHLIELDYLEYQDVLEHIISELEDGALYESLLDNLSKKMKTGMEFIKNVSNILNVRLLDVMKLFKEKVLFVFCTKIMWSAKKLVELVKDGYKLQTKLKKSIAQYIANTGVVKFTSSELTKLDEFLNEHKFVKTAGSLVVIGFLIYQWTEMISFTGDIEFDFDQSLLFAALQGSYSLSDLFSSPDGIEMLVFIATGMLIGASFPWPGPSWALFLVSIVYTVAKKNHPIIAKSIIKNVKKLKNIKV